MTAHSPLPVLVIRHVPHDDLGLLVHSLHSHNLPFQFADLHSTPDAPIQLSRHSSLIVLGGPQSVNSRLDYLNRERLLIEQALQLQMPVLAICLGAQLLAHTLGARVYSATPPEIGFLPVSPTPLASADPLFENFTQQPVFHWHNETFDLPAGAVLLAKSKACPHQAFRYRQRAWGIQFHLEITPQTISQWLREDESCGAAREATTPIDPHLYEQELQTLAASVFDPWAQLVVG